MGIVVTKRQKPTTNNTPPHSPTSQVNFGNGPSFSPSRGSRGPAIDTASKDGGRENGDGIPYQGNSSQRNKNTTRPTWASRRLRFNRRHHIQDASIASTMSNKRAKQRLPKKTKSAIKIATLNMRGRTSSNPLLPPDKWEKINQLMKQDKIGILTIQEAHLTDTQALNLEAQYKRLKILKSQGTNPRAAGVAFVINRDIVPDQDIETYELMLKKH